MSTVAPYTASDVRQMESMLRRGWTQRQIAAHIGRSVSSVSSACQRHSRLDGRDVYRERERAVTDAEVALAKALITSGKGMSAQQAAREIGVSGSALRAWLRREGWDPIVKRTEARRQQVKRLTDLGWSSRRIAAELHLSKTTITADQRWIRAREERT